MNSNTIERGRSMIEMLGVLAVIGVLSVAGLAGYSKAMDRYKINETINQVTYIVQNTRDLFKTQYNLYGDMDSTSTTMSTSTYANRKLADKAKLFPASLVKNGYKNLFGGDIYFYPKGRFSENDGKAFILTFFDIPQEICIEIATRDWQGNLGLVAMSIRGEIAVDNALLKETYQENCTTKYKDGNTVICANDMPVSIEQATSACNGEVNNKISWKFY